jgi:hypothetical protein
VDKDLAIYCGILLILLMIAAIVNQFGNDEGIDE